MCTRSSALRLVGEGGASKPTEPRWVRLATNAGWVPPDVLYLVEHSAALEKVQELLEHLAGVLPYDVWLDVAHAANLVCDVVAVPCPCHPASDSVDGSQGQGALC